MSSSGEPRANARMPRFVAFFLAAGLLLVAVVAFRPGGGIFTMPTLGSPTAPMTRAAIDSSTTPATTRATTTTTTATKHEKTSTTKPKAPTAAAAVVAAHLPNKDHADEKHAQQHDAHPAAHPAHPAADAAGVAERPLFPSLRRPFFNTNISASWLQSLPQLPINERGARSALSGEWKCVKSTEATLAELIKEHADTHTKTVVLVRFDENTQLLANNTLRSLDTVKVSSYVAVPTTSEARKLCAGLCAPCAVDLPNGVTTPQLAKLALDVSNKPNVLIVEGDVVFRGSNPLTMLNDDALDKADVAFACEASVSKDDVHSFSGATQGITFFRNRPATVVFLDQWSHDLSAAVPPGLEASRFELMRPQLMRSDRWITRALTAAVTATVAKGEVHAACLNRLVHLSCRSHLPNDATACSKITEHTGFHGVAALIEQNMQLKTVLPADATKPPCKSSDIMSVRYNCRFSLADVIRAMHLNGDWLVQLPSATIPDRMLVERGALAGSRRGHAHLDKDGKPSLGGAGGMGKFGKTGKFGARKMNPGHGHDH